MLDDFLPMQEPYTPKQALQAINDGVPVLDVLARLDVDQCHFTKRVDDQGKEPVVRTGLSCYTAPSSGVLVFSLEEMKRQQEAGNKVILVVSDGMFKTEIKDLKPADGLIFLCPKKDKNQRNFYNHFLINVSYLRSVLLDNRLKPRITMLKDNGEIQHSTGQILREGDLVTIDPESGQIWPGELPMLPPDENSRKLVEFLTDMDMSEDITRVAVHVSQPSDYRAAFKLKSESRDRLHVGLHRTDMRCHRKLGQIDESVLASLSDGAVPLDLRGWDSYGFREMPTNYRLPDLHNIRDVLPSESVEALDRGEDHKLGSRLFTFRETLYQNQLGTAIRNCEMEISGDVMHVIIPSVKTAEEVVHFKKMVEELTPLELRGQIKFGVMIETKEALDNIKEIAPLCDCLCVGTNGLTESLTGLDRSVLDHSEYMKKHGLDGVSPYEALVPEVVEPLAEALFQARRANPDIFINMCGYQTGGHDISSINTALEMGVDQLTVPPHLENMLRTQVAIAAHHAHYKLYVEPNYNYGMDLF